MPLTAAQQKQRLDEYKGAIGAMLPENEARTIAAALGFHKHGTDQLVFECSGEHAANWFIDRDGMHVFRPTGETMLEYGKRALIERPHLAPSKPEPGAIDDGEAAFGEKPTLAARGAFLKKHGQAEYERVAALYGADLRTLKPGRRPDESGDANEGEAKPRKPLQSKNPWSDEYVELHGIKAAYTARASIMKSLGLRKAGEMAAAVGRTVTGAALSR